MNNEKENQNEYVNEQELPAFPATPELSGGPTANEVGYVTDEANGECNEIADQANSKHTVSAKKIEANRQNAKRSTGPTTDRGKKSVSMNAVRHGFFAKSLLIQHRDGHEDPADYGALYSEVHEHYKPVGWVEERLVEQIVFMSWRQRRVFRWESGMISKALAENNY